MRRLFVLLIGFVILGCGGGGTPTHSLNPTDAFKVGDTQWELELNENWQKISAPEGFNTVFLAQSGVQNFVILQEQGATENLALDILTKASENFIEFEEVNLNEKTNTFRFRGKTDHGSVFREFVQKVFVIPETNAFLLGSCSWEPNIASSADCLNLVDSWQISVDKPVEEK